MTKERDSSEDSTIYAKLNNNKVFLIIASIIIVITCVLIYSNIYDNSTHFDDEFIMKNTALHDPNDFDALFSINKFRVVPFWTFAYNYVNSDEGKDLSGFYTFNIIIHIINSLLVFFIIYLIFRTPVIVEMEIYKYGAIFAFLTAMIFAAHPLQTQAVTYIYQRLASLAATFYFATFLSYLLGRLSKSGIIFRVIFYLLSLIFLIFGVFSKENMFTIFPMILLVELMLFNKNFKISPIIIGVFLGLMALGFFIFFQFQVFSNVFTTIINFNSETITSESYLLTQFKVLPLYFKLFLYPFNQNFDHDIRVAYSIDNDVIMGMIFIALIIGFAIYMYKYNRLITFGIFWFILTISVESSIIPIADVVFEHRVYLPMIGLILALIGVLYEIFSRKKELIPVLFVILLFFIGMNSVLAYQRNFVWQSEKTLWSDVVKKSPNKARAYFKLGQANLLSGKVNWALADFTKVIELQPDFLSAYTYRAAIYLTLSKNREALKDQNSFIDLSKDKTQGYLNRARTYMKMKAYGSAAADYEKYLKVNNEDVRAYYELADTYEQFKDFDNSIKALQKALKVDSNNAETQYRLGRQFFIISNFKESLLWLDKALQNPQVNNKILSQVHYIKGNYFFYHSNLKSSAEEYEKAVELNADYKDAIINLALIHREKREYIKELEKIDRVIELEPKNDINWQARGFCNTNLKRYNDAENDLKRAIELNPRNEKAKAKLKEIAKYL